MARNFLLGYRHRAFKSLGAEFCFVSSNIVVFCSGNKFLQYLLDFVSFLFFSFDIEF